MGLQLANWTIWDVCLVLLGALSLVYLLTPPLATALGLIQITVTMAEDHAAAREVGTAPRFDRLHNGLTECGFEPVCVIREVVWMAGLAWRRVTVGAALEHRRCGTLALVYRSPGDAWHVALCTRSTDGALIQTHSAAPGPGVLDSRRSVWGMNTSGLPNLLREHRAHVAYFLAYHEQSVADITAAWWVSIVPRETRHGLKRAWSYRRLLGLGVIGSIGVQFLALWFAELFPDLAGPALVGGAVVAVCLCRWGCLYVDWIAAAVQDRF